MPSWPRCSRNKSGGIALYAHEAWRKYLILRRARRDVRLLDRLVGRALDQRPRRRHADPGASGSPTRRGPRAARASTSSLPILIGIGLIVLVWLFNVYGVRPAVWFGYLTGAPAAASPPSVLMFLPYITGDWHSSNIQWNIGTGGGLPLVLTWLYFMCWSAYGIEVVADLRARVPRHRARHAEGAALGGAVLRRGLRAAAARPGRHARHEGRRRRPDVHQLLHPGLRQARGQRADATS